MVLVFYFNMLNRGPKHTNKKGSKRQSLDEIAAEERKALQTTRQINGSPRRSRR
jgi:hypothetical protein